MHRELAERLPAGEAARHHTAAGDVALGREAALRAADAARFPSERARNLLLAAGPGGAESVAVSGVERDLVLRAADAFLEAGETAEVQCVLDRFDRCEPNPDVELRRARLCWQEGDPEGARAAAARGLQVARGTDTAVEVGLRLEELKYVVRVEFDGDRAIALATEAHRLARAIGTDRTQALTTLGSAHLVAGTGEWSTYLEAAISRAALDREPEAGLEASNAFIAAHMLAGDRGVARRGAARAARIAHRTGRRRWEEQFTITTNFLALLAGRCSSVALWGRDFVQPGLTTAVHIAYVAYALALADLGSNREALKVVAEGRAIDVGDDTGRSLLRWAEAETHWLGGCPEQALESAELCIAAGGSHFPSVPLAQAARAWAQYDLGVMPQPVESEGWAFAGAARSDSQGVVALAIADYGAALRHFDESAAAADDVPRYALRARWGAAEALRLAGDVECATARLVALECDATAYGLQALGGRARRSLRALGHRRAADAARDEHVTRRQREVLALVAEGHSSAEIAALLGVQTGTVESHVSAAMARLGARTRQQAALLAAKEIPV